MKILEILFILSPMLSAVHAGKENACPSSFCGNFSLGYPFKTETTQPQNDCPYVNLTCNETLATPIVNLPFAGDFYIRLIGYYDRYIQLYDPGNCLMRRLMKNLNLSSSPFKAIAYENYTFYMCPSNASPIGIYVFPIDCLSNSTNSMVATNLVIIESMLQSGCNVVGTWALPVLAPDQFELEGTSGDLYLTWDSISCKACEKTDHQGDKGTRINPFIAAWAIEGTAWYMKLQQCTGFREGWTSLVYFTHSYPVTSARGCFHNSTYDL